MRSAGKERNKFRSTTPHGSDKPAANSPRSQGSELNEVTEKKWRCCCFTDLFQVWTTRLMGSSRCITDQSRYPIEVGIVTGKVREPVRHHDRHDHRVVGQESVDWLSPAAASTSGVAIVRTWMPICGIFCNADRKWTRRCTAAGFCFSRSTTLVGQPNRVEASRVINLWATSPRTSVEVKPREFPQFDTS